QLRAGVPQAGHLGHGCITQVEPRAGRQPEQIDANRGDVLTHLSGRQEGPYPRQTSGPRHFAVVTLRVEPYAGPAPVVFLNAARADRDTQQWVPAAEEGVRQFVAEQARQGRRVVGTRVMLTRLAGHPVASRASSFERAACLALAQAF